jgi:hypothetical protein
MPSEGRSLLVDKRNNLLETEEPNRPAFRWQLEKRYAGLFCVLSQDIPTGIWDIFGKTLRIVLYVWNSLRSLWQHTNGGFWAVFFQ